MFIDQKSTGATYTMHMVSAESAQPTNKPALVTHTDVRMSDIPLCLLFNTKLYGYDCLLLRYCITDNIYQFNYLFHCPS